VQLLFSVYQRIRQYCCTICLTITFFYNLRERLAYGRLDGASVQMPASHAYAASRRGSRCCVLRLYRVPCRSISIYAHVVSRLRPLHTHAHTGRPSSCTRRLLSAADGSHCNMCNTRSTFVTSRGNICNIRPKQLKHLQHTSETLAKYQKNSKPRV
jgi:hypothetical protein